MKVLKTGKWNVPWTHITRCKTCEAELELEEADVSARGYINSPVYKWECAICKKENILKNSDLPQRMLEGKIKEAGLSYERDWRD